MLGQFVLVGETTRLIHHAQTHQARNGVNQARAANAHRLRVANRGIAQATLVDNDFRDSTRIRRHATADVSALEHRARCRGARNRARRTAQRHFAVRAQVNQQRGSIFLQKMHGHNTARDVAAHVTCQTRRENRLRQRIKERVGQRFGATEKRKSLVRSRANGSRIHARGQRFHGGVTRNKETFHLVRSCLRVFEHLFCHRSKRVADQRALRLKHAIHACGNTAHYIGAIGNLRVRFARSSQNVARLQVNQAHGNRSRSNVHRKR